MLQLVYEVRKSPAASGRQPQETRQGLSVLPSAFDGTVYRLLDLRDRAVDYIVSALNVLLWPFAFLFELLMWSFGQVRDLYRDYRELYDDFAPRGILLDFFLSGGFGVLLFWIFGPGNLTITLPFMEFPVALGVAILAMLFGLLTVPLGLWVVYEFLFTEDGTNANDSHNFWAAGFVLFVLYTGFSLGYYLPWLFDTLHL